MAVRGQLFLERHHRNGLIAKVSRSPESNEFTASVTDPGQIGIEVVGVRTGFLKEHEARQAADRLAHRDCNETCAPWRLVSER